jgi:hypothetical protein
MGAAFGKFLRMNSCLQKQCGCTDLKTISRQYEKLVIARK